MKKILEWLNNFISLNSKKLFVIAVTCWIIYFTPESFLISVSLFDLWLALKQWILCIALISSLVLFANLLYKLMDYIYQGVGNLVKNYRFKKSHFRIMASLSRVEKEILAKYIAEDTTTYAFDVRDGIVQGLVAKDILYRPGNLSNPLTAANFDYNLHPWVVDYLSKNPNFLKDIQPSERQRHDMLEW